MKKKRTVLLKSKKGAVAPDEFEALKLKLSNSGHDVVDVMMNPEAEVHHDLVLEPLPERPLWIRRLFGVL